MESYINYITTIATDGDGRSARAPHRARLLRSRKGSRPTSRAFSATGRFASATRLQSQTQNDVYGSVVLAATQMFVDERLPKMGDEALFRLLEAAWANARSSGRSSPTPDYGNIAADRARPHLFRDAVLGGLRPAGGDRAAARTSPTAPSIGGPTRDARARADSQRGLG